MTPTGSLVQASEQDVPLPLEPARTPADRAFRALLLACSATVLVIIGAIAVYLFVNSLPALRYSGLHFLTSSHWDPLSKKPSYGILGDLVGSVLIAVIALVLAMPVSIAAALMINEYAPRRLRSLFTGLVDLLAALPSLIFGLWGLEFLSTYLYGTTKWLSRHGDFIPLFRTPQQIFGNSIFVCGVVVSIMIVPIITSISREVMSQTPREDCEAALALGGTRWGMITEVILPFARDGIVGGALLGLGRAMGETIAIALILASTHGLTARILEPGGGSIAALIVQQFTSVPARARSALVLAALVLFATTLIVNVAARMVVARGARSSR